MDVQHGKISKIVLDNANANAGTQRGRAMLEASLRMRGAGRSLVLDRNFKAIGGNKTAETAMDVGLEDVIFIHTDGTKLVAVVRDDMDLDDPETGARELAYLDNRTSEVGLEWDASQIAFDVKRGVDFQNIFTAQETGIMLERAAELGDFDEDEPEDLDDVSDELPGAAALKLDMQFESDEPYGIPPFDPDMLSEIPAELDVWAGPDASDPEYPGWWLYCYGSDSVRGLDFERTILAFYVDDLRFDKWWFDPDIYTAKALNAGITLAISPNFSLWAGQAKAIHIYNTFRARWIGRYLQEAGIAVIPDVNWASEDSFEFCLAGIPEHAPAISIQIQTIANDLERDMLRAGVDQVIRTLKPDSLLLYGGGDSSRMVVASVIPDSLPVTWLESRATRRRDRVLSVRDHSIGDSPDE